ncbi:MAG: hypothetical protein ACFB51_02855 [Anaerolineae bacterium]
MQLNPSRADRAAGLPPVLITQYLEASGWERTAETTPDESVWESESQQVRLPATQGAPDFAAKATALVETLAHVEGCSPLTIYTRIATINSHVLRITINRPDRARGDLITAADASQVIDGIKKMAYALAEDRKRAFFDLFRLAASEEGSHVFVVASPPLASLLDAEEDARLLAVERFFTGLMEVTAALSGEAGSEPDLPAAYVKGVEKILRAAGRDGTVHLDITWASTRPQEAKGEAALEPDQRDDLSDMAEALDPTPEPEFAEVRGFITELVRRRDGEDTIIVQGVEDNAPRAEAALLSETESLDARTAFDDNLPVLISGLAQQKPGRLFFPDLDQLVINPPSG